MTKTLFGIATAVVVVGMLNPAHGEIVIELGNGDPTDTLGYVKTGDNTAYGYFLGDQSKAPVVNFLTDVNLIVPSEGQARIDAETTLFSDVTITPQAQYVLLGFEANPSGAGPSKTPYTFTVTATDQFGVTFTKVFEFDTNGQNFFTATATEGEVIATLNINTSTPLIQTISQVRVDLSAGPAQVPEPASIAMLGFSSLVGLGYAWRRRGRVVA